MTSIVFNDVIQNISDEIGCDNISLHLHCDDECLFMLSTTNISETITNIYTYPIDYDGKKLVDIRFINPNETEDKIISYIKDNNIENIIKEFVFKWLIGFKNNLYDKKKISSLSNIIHQDLSTVLVSSELLSKTSLDREQRIHCKDISSHSIQVTKTINDLIDHYKLSSGFLLYNLKIFNIQELIEDLNNSSRMNLNGVNILFNIDDSIPEYIFADSDKIEHCILGILRLSERYLIKKHYVNITVNCERNESKYNLVFIIKQYWKEQNIINNKGVITTSLNYFEHIYYNTTTQLLNIIKGDMAISIHDDTINTKFIFPVNTLCDLNTQLQQCIKKDLINTNVLCIDSNIGNRMKVSSILTNLYLLPIQCMTVEEAIQTLNIQSSFLFVMMNISDNEIPKNKINNIMKIISKYKYPIVFVYDIRKKIDTNIYSGTDCYTLVNPISKTSLYNVIYKIFRKIK
jgi:hypothetical protein